jgi:predicted dehydrogenase
MRVCELKDEKGETPAYGAKLRTEPVPAGENGGANDPAAISHAGHRTQIADFLESIETGRPPAITGEDARKPLEVILAVYRSAREGREVSLPLTSPPQEIRTPGYPQRSEEGGVPRFPGDPGPARS